MDATLHAVEGRITPTGSDQIVVRAVFNEPATLNGNDAIAGAHRREAVRDDEHRAALGDFAHVLLNDPLALVVKRARGLIEDEDTGIANQGTSNSDALALAAGERSASLAHHRVVTLGQLENEVMCPGERGTSNHALHRHCRIDKRNIVAHLRLNNTFSCSTTPI